MFEKVNILGVEIANLSVNEIVDILIENSKKNNTQCVFTPNSEIIELVRKDEALLHIINSADILSADGIGVVYAAKILGNPLKERAAGFDIATKLLEKGENEGLSFFFFGSKDEVAKKAKQNIEKKYPNIKIVGTRSGYFSDDENIAEEILEKNPNIVFVCLGAPKQEKWIYENKEKLKGKILIGLGGSLDVFAGVAKRAPDIYIKLNIEWLYRLIKQPTRFIRMLALPKFLMAVIFSNFSNKK
jgi:N-acetylglucosaminyldiphosphoundecaprenol N-acetyl-beta-D-mannosaminyltransferase